MAQYAVTIVAALLTVQYILFQIEVAYIARCVQLNSLQKADYDALIKRFNVFAQEVHSDYDFYAGADKSWTRKTQIILAAILILFVLVVLLEFASRSKHAEIRLIYLCGWIFALWMVFRTYRVVKITISYNTSTFAE